MGGRGGGGGVVYVEVKVVCVWVVERGRGCVEIYCGVGVCGDVSSIMSSIMEIIDLQQLNYIKIFLATFCEALFTFIQIREWAELVNTCSCILRCIYNSD